MLELLELAVTDHRPDVVAKPVAALERALSWVTKVPTSESCVLASDFFCAIAVAGAFSAATSALMMLDQSVPEPMPAKVRVGVVVTEEPPQKTKRRRRVCLRQRRVLRLAAAEQRE